VDPNRVINNAVRLPNLQLLSLVHSTIFSLFMFWWHGDELAEGRTWLDHVEAAQ
jgi:hypothetical protein